MTPGFVGRVVRMVPKGQDRRMKKKGFNAVKEFRFLSCGATCAAWTKDAAHDLTPLLDTDVKSKTTATLHGNQSIIGKVNKQRN